MPNQFLSPEGDLENYFVSESWLIDQWVGDTLWTWGRNNSGQLGNNNTTTPICTPVTTSSGGTNWKQVAGGNTYTSAIKTDGTLWIWGLNSDGQLGVIDTTQRNTPVQTSAGGTNWKQVAGGNNHAVAIKTDGTLWTWGSGTSGKLGNNNFINIYTPVTTFAGGTNWKQVNCGDSHTAAIKTDGTLWTWGLNSYGQLGINVAGAGTNKLTPVTTFAGGTNWKQVACGSFHFTAAIKTDGTLWIWGRGNGGQLGNNTATTRCTPVTTFAGGTNWKQVSCGGGHTAAIKTDGTLWTWGYNGYGQLGINDVTDRSTPVQTSSGGTNWKQVACGLNYTSAIKTDGTLWNWGKNNFGNLGINDVTDRSTPVQTSSGGTNWKQVSCGAFHTIAVTSGTDPTYFIS